MRWLLWKLSSMYRVREAHEPFPYGEFHLLPGGTPHRETVLEPGDLITHVTLPPPPAGSRQVYLKLRDRASYEFALASCAGRLTIAGGNITRARVALGGVGTKPWRSPEAEAVLAGKPATRRIFRQAAEAAMRRRQAAEQNKFKIELAKRCLDRTRCKWPPRPDFGGAMMATSTGHPRQVLPYRARHPSGGRSAAKSPERRSTRQTSVSRDALCGARGGDDREGNCVKLDTAAAEKMPGVRAVFIAGTSGRFPLHPARRLSISICRERRPPFEDDVIRYWGQYIALAVADTFEPAKAAADAVRATYLQRRPTSRRTWKLEEIRTLF